ADYVSALGKKGRKMSTEKKTRARKQAEEPIEIQVGSIACGAEGVTFTIPWGEVRKHLEVAGLLPAEDGVGSKEPAEPVTGLTLVKPVEKPGPGPLGEEPAEPSSEEAPLPQVRPEMLASLPAATGNREPTSRAEL